MAMGIPASKLSAEARELANEAPWFRAVAQRIGLDFNTLDKEGAAAVREAAQDPTVLANARKAIGNTGTPAAEAAADAAPDISADAAKARLATDTEAPAPVRGPSDVRADLEHPPAVRPGGMTAPAVEGEYIEPPTALARREAPADFTPGAPPPAEAPGELPPAPALGALPAPPADKRKAAATAATLIGAGAAAKLADQGGDSAVPGAAKADEPEPPASGATATPPPPVTPGGTIDAPAFIKDLPGFVAKKYTGPAMPKEGDFSTTQIGDEKISPTAYMARAEKRLVGELNGLAEQYKQERDQLKQRELFEGIVNAIGHLAAGWYGQHYGVDMSGTKFDATDWVAQGEALRRNFDSLQGVAKDKFGAAERTGQAAERDTEQRWNRNVKVYEAAVNQYNHENEEAYREWQVKAKNIDTKNQMTHWQQELKLQEDRLDATLGKAKTAAEAKTAAAAQKQLTADKATGMKVATLVASAVNAKNADAGMVALSQAKQLNDDLASRGRNVLPPETFIDKRAGNSIFQFGQGDNVPGLAKPATVSKQLVDAQNKQIQDAGAPKPVQAAATAAPAPAKTISPAKLQAYATAYKMTPEQAAAHLKSQGYTIGQ